MSDDPRERPWVLIPGLNAPGAGAAMSVRLGPIRVHCVSTGAGNWWVGHDRCPGCGAGGLALDGTLGRLSCAGCGRVTDPAAEAIPGLPCMDVDDEVYVLLDDE